MAKYILKGGKFTSKAVDDILEHKIISFDTETNGLKVKSYSEEFKVVSIIISTIDNSYYIPVNHRFYDKNIRESRAKDLLQPIFNDESICLVAHNFNFDRHVLNRIGLKVQNKNYFDTLLAARMINQEDSNSLEALLKRELGIKGLHKFDEVVGTVSKERKDKVGLSGNSKATFDLVEINKAAIYGIEDTENLIDLKVLLENRLKEEGLYDIYTNLIVPRFSNVFFNMEDKGVKIDMKELNRISEIISKDVKETKKEMDELIGIDINYDSPKQVSELLYNEYSSDPPCEICKNDVCERKAEGYCEEYSIWEKYGHKNPNIDIREKSFNFPVPERTDTEQPSSGKNALKRFVHYEPKNEWQEVGLELIDLILKYKKISKLKSTFVDGLRDAIYEDGKAHPSFNGLGAKSGRASSSDPNGQNLPSQDDEDKYKIRKLFIPNRNRKMLAVD